MSVRPKKANRMSKLSSSHAVGPTSAISRWNSRVAGLGELVDDPRAPGDRRRLAGDLLDQGTREHLLQRGVERPVRQHPTPAEHEVEPLAQLVAVHGSLVQQSEDCQLDGLATTCHATYRSDISAEP